MNDLFEQGYKILKPDTLEHQALIIKVCLQIIFELAGKDLDVSYANKELYVNILSEDMLAKYPILVSWLLQYDIYKITSDIIGNYPRLDSVAIYYTPRNTEVGNSQLWHRDNDQRHKQCKLFITLTDSSEPDHGGLWWLSRPESKIFTDYLMENNDKTKHFYSRWFELQKIQDEEAAPALKGLHPRQLIGPTGSGVIADTSECYHYGGRVRGIPARFTFVAHFCTYDLGPNQNLKNTPGKAIVDFKCIEKHIKGRMHRNQLSLSGHPDDNPHMVPCYYKEETEE